MIDIWIKPHSHIIDEWDGTPLMFSCAFVPILNHGLLVKGKIYYWTLRSVVQNLEILLYTHVHFSAYLLLWHYTRIFVGFGRVPAKGPGKSYEGPRLLAIARLCPRR